MALTNFLNIAYVDIIILILFLIAINELWNSYTYEKEHSDRFITKAGDFNYNIEKYEKSNLYHHFSNLSSHDKEFVDDYIVYTYLNNKENKPDFSKKMKLARNQLIVTTICASYLLDTPFIKSFRQNVLTYIIANLF